MYLGVQVKLDDQLRAKKSPKLSLAQLYNGKHVAYSPGRRKSSKTAAMGFDSKIRGKRVLLRVVFGIRGSL